MIRPFADESDLGPDPARPSFRTANELVLSLHRIAFDLTEAKTRKTTDRFTPKKKSNLNKSVYGRKFPRYFNSCYFILTPRMLALMLNT